MRAKPEGMRYFQQVRTLFESALAEEAAWDGTQDDVAALDKALLANEAAIGNDACFMRTDVKFHVTIATIPGNPLAEWLLDQRSVSLRHPGTQGLPSHRRIFEAIKAKDPIVRRVRHALSPQPDSRPLLENHRR
jgi:DNA-binding FadR family transcriptional regulator